MSEGPAVVADSLEKKYGEVRALTGLSLKVERGEIYGLLGPNGAGKTTTLRIVSGLEAPSAGTIRVLGLDPVGQPVEVKKVVGYVAESAALYESLTPREYFEFVASVRELSQRGVERAAGLAEAFDLQANMDKAMGTLSLGTKQKVSVIAAMMHEPPLLLLDEPLNGLDAKSGRILKELIGMQAKRGAVIFSTHVMEVAQAVCTRIGIVNQGRLVTEGTFDELKKKAGSGDSNLEDVFLRLTDEEEAIAATLKKLEGAGP